MRNKHAFLSGKQGPQGNRELLFYMAVPVSVFLFAFVIPWRKIFVTINEQYPALLIEEIIITIIVITFFALGFTVSRLKKYKQTIGDHQTSEQHLVQSLKQLELLMGNSQVILFNAEATGDLRPIYVSKNFTTILGYTVEESFNKNFWIQNVHPDDLPVLLAARPSLYAAGTAVYEYRLKHKDGSWKWLHAEVKMIYGEKGEPREFLGSWIDITEQKLAQEAIRKSEERLYLASQATGNIIYEWNSVTNEVWISDTIFNLYGYIKPETDITIEWWVSKVHPDDLDRIMASSHEHIEQQKQVWTDEYRFRKADGSYAFIYDRALIAYNADGSFNRWIGSMTDTTEVKNTQEELRLIKEKNEEFYRANQGAVLNNDEADEKIRILEQLIETQNRNVYIKNNNILNQRKELEQHMYIASHDLQEPLRTTLSLVSMLREEMNTTGKLNENEMMCMDGIIKMTGRMQTIVKDLMDYSRLGKDRVLKKINCMEIMSTVLEDLQAAIQESKAEIHVDNLPELMAYPTEIKLLFQNLIGNAIKYRKKDLAPVIHVSTERNCNTWKFSVLDNGIGIEEKHLKKVFMLFQRLHTRDKYEGNGIGLAHCKKIVELHSGNIWVESFPGEGSIFYFTISDKINEV